MMVSLSVSFLWLLALAAAAVHAQDGRRTLGNGLRMAAAFVLVTPAALWLSPQPNWIGVLMALGVFWRLIAGPLPRIGGVLGGASAALAAALQIAAGAAPWLAIGLTIVALGGAFWWGGNRDSGMRRREALLVGIAILLPPVALLGDILFGWQSAAVLGQGAVDLSASAPPAWAIAVLALALLAGLMKGLWVRR
jgi:hypothetical protein